MIGRINKLGRKSKAIVYAVGVHLLVVVVLGISFNWKIPTAAAPDGEAAPVQATIIPEAALNEEIAKIEQRQLDKKKKEEEEKQRLEDLIKEAAEKEEERKKQEQEIEDLKKKQEEEKQKAEEVAEMRKKEEAQLSKLKLEKECLEKYQKLSLEEIEKAQSSDEDCADQIAEVKVKKVEESKKEEALIAERKKKEEEDRKKKEAEEEKQRLAELEAEKKRKADAEKKRLAKIAADKKAKADAERALQAQLESERVRGEAKAALVGNIGAIQRKVSRNWLQPQSFKPGQTAKIQVKVSPTGDIIDAKIVSGSGDPIFDRSVFNAVMKSSPLPIPQDARYYPHIQTFNFLFSPYG